MKRRSRSVIAGILALAAGLFLAPDVRGAEEEDPWRPALDRWEWSFPEDHGSHPDFETEWWYFTGNLETSSGRDFGYQVTFFRAGLAKIAPVPENPWSIRDLYLAHFALTDVEKGRFSWKERVSRAGPGLAGAKVGDLDVQLLDWKAVSSEKVVRLAARWGDMDLDLTLRPRKPPVFHGEGGLSRKGPNPGQASFYYSMTDLATEGYVRPPGEDPVPVSGRSWFDHEFGSNQLAPDQAGWDWFGLHLSDGRELMIYIMRKKDGAVEEASSGTLIHPDGTWNALRLEDFSVAVEDTWESPASGGRYPAGWLITVPGAGIRIRVLPMLDNQEMLTEETGGIIYWEGAVSLAGQSGEREVSGGGYVELTGYAGSLGGKF